MTTTTRVPGWRVVLDAFLAAPERTLTNTELGQVRGVQAWHQRVSDLRRKGYLLTEAVRVGEGYYAYRLVGVQRGSEGHDREGDALPVLAGLAVAEEQQNAGEALAAQAASLLDRAKGGPSAAHPSPPSSLPRQRDEARAEVERLRERVADLERSADELDEAVEADLRREQSARDALAEILLPDGADASGHTLVALAEIAVQQLRDAGGRRRSRQPGAGRGPTGPQLMRKALEHHGDPMHAAAIAEWVMTHGGDAIYKGKTPAATMAAQLATSSKAGGEFEKVSPGCYALREWTDEEKALTPIRPAGA